MSCRTRRAIASGARVATTALGLSLALFTLSACGSEQDVTDTSASGGNGAVASAEQPADAPSTSAPVVPGRKPASARPNSVTSGADADESTQGGPGTTCGSIPGPDGALRVLVLAGDVDCDQAKSIADEYGPKIVTGTQQSVGGWTCGPSALQGVLAACQKDTTVIGFAP
ncbi:MULTISPECIES: hypothetical protein [Gordonia]|uniref:Uncharacterized protein n=1 Tax=Gordonia alkanivorans NBRC 16433 TaxID=1027371 RepID=F9VW28_9ACTN|nr:MULTISPECIES: hypothetical protein [Gordonia]MDH3021377.1 hypothetical protein [Gordonia alkanivorans]MDH3050698.1 hypothetical protein [Gordonia alkanivorans]MDJ0008846.1 hypothetical protein [Gordonia alkanivorans]MDJ0029247.1 hypothetical protein [Gordonia alkanivorans]MDJ0098864.1 hypothetical protein [Gordonia alkanivorans]